MVEEERGEIAGVDEWDERDGREGWKVDLGTVLRREELKKGSLWGIKEFTGAERPAIGCWTTLTYFGACARSGIGSGMRETAFTKYLRALRTEI